LSRRKDVSDYTFRRFVTEQFAGARLNFLAWFEVARDPQSAPVHPLLREQFGDGLDPREVEEVFTWWREGLDELAVALDHTQTLLDDGMVLKDQDGQEVNDECVKRLLSIARHVENLSSHLLKNLGESRYQDA